MNKVQRLFYRYKFEQQLPSRIRNNLTEITIHQVINSKVAKKTDKRFSDYPIQFGYRRRKDNISNFVFHALHNNDIKMLRIVLNRFPEELLKQVHNVIPKHEPKQYTPFRMFKGWKIKLEKIENNSCFI